MHFQTKNLLNVLNVFSSDFLFLRGGGKLGLGGGGGGGGGGGCEGRFLLKHFSVRICLHWLSYYYSTLAQILLLATKDQTVQ